jgi:hypothetical protein
MSNMMRNELITHMGLLIGKHSIQIDYLRGISKRSKEQRTLIVKFSQVAELVDASYLYESYRFESCPDYYNKNKK